MSYTEEKIDIYRKYNFDKHVAILKEYPDNISVLDWKAPGTGIYGVRYIFDQNYIYISGDLGCAVLNIDSKVVLRAVYNNDLNYFAGKIKCSTDLYVFDKRTAIENINEHTEIDVKWRNVMLEALDDICSVEGWRNFLLEIEFNDEYKYDWAVTFGQVYNVRVIGWMLGLKMAYEQINGQT